MSTAPSMFNDSLLHQPSPLDNYVQPNLGHALRIWWAYYWRTTIIATVLTILVDIAVRYFFDHSFFLSGRVARLMLQANSYVCTFAVAFLIFRYLLTKKFRNFRIVLLPPDDIEATTGLPVTWSRSARVWWAFTWRSILYSLGGYVAVMLPLGWYAGMFQPGPVVAFFLFGGVALVVNAALSLFVIYSSILDEDFGDFRVCLQPKRVMAPPV